VSKPARLTAASDELSLATSNSTQYTQIYARFFRRNNEKNQI